MIIPRIGITLGDPGGIGPETVLKALSQKESLPKAQYTLFGSAAVIKEEERELGLQLNIPIRRRIEDTSDLAISLLDIETSLQAVKKGYSSRENGQASFLFFKAAVNEAEKGNLRAIITSPISKKSWSLAGLGWRGHTDYLSQSYPQAVMSFWSDRLNIALLSHHLSLKEALKLVNRRNLFRFFRLLRACTEGIRPGGFHFLVAGLNPHAGEEGLLGREEEKEIEPAVTKAQDEGMSISGPFPPDVVFRRALGHPERVVIALYHDQGLIPFKLEAFERGVNATLGLPFIRTSPDHGTAFDIAGRGMANPQSLIEAIRLALKLSSASF